MWRSNTKIKGNEPQEERMDATMEDGLSVESSLIRILLGKSQAKRIIRKCSRCPTLIKTSCYEKICIHAMESDNKCEMEEEENQMMSNTEEPGKAYNALCPIINISKKE